MVSHSYYLCYRFQFWLQTSCTTPETHFGEETAAWARVKPVSHSIHTQQHATHFVSAVCSLASESDSIQNKFCSSNDRPVILFARLQDCQREGASRNGLGCMQSASIRRVNDTPDHGCLAQERQQRAFHRSVMGPDTQKTTLSGTARVRSTRRMSAKQNSWRA